MIVVLAEKPSVARDISAVLGASHKQNGYFEGNNYQVTYAFGQVPVFLIFKYLSGSPPGRAGSCGSSGF